MLLHSFTYLLLYHNYTCMLHVYFTWLSLHASDHYCIGHDFTYPVCIWYAIVIKISVKETLTLHVCVYTIHLTLPTPFMNLSEKRTLKVLMSLWASFSVFFPFFLFQIKGSDWTFHCSPKKMLTGFFFPSSVNSVAVCFLPLMLQIHWRTVFVFFVDLKVLNDHLNRYWLLWHDMYMCIVVLSNINLYHGFLKVIFD